MSMPRLADSRGNQERALPDSSVFSHLDNEGIDENEGKDTQGALPPLFDQWIQSLAELGDERFAEARSTEFLSDGIYFSGGDSLENHFAEGEDEGLLASLVSLPEIWAELAFSGSRNAEGEGSDSGLHLSLSESVSVSRSVFAPLVRFRLEGLRRLVDEQLVEDLLDESLESVSSGEQPLQAGVIYRNLELSHLLSPRTFEV